MTTRNLSKAQYLTDLELYELMVAAYPEKFADREENGDDLWDEIMEFVDDMCGEMDEQALRALLGRIVLLSMPMRGMNGDLSHALGVVEINGENASMMAAVKRPMLQ
jgi:hypothetical protein